MNTLRIAALAIITALTFSATAAFAEETNPPRQSQSDNPGAKPSPTPPPSNQNDDGMKPVPQPNMPDPPAMPTVPSTDD